MSEPPAVAGGPAVEMYGPVATAPGSDKLARVAQLTERWSYKPEVEGLSPSLGTNKTANCELRIADLELVRTKSERTANSHFAIRNPKFLSGRDSSPAER